MAPEILQGKDGSPTVYRREDIVLLDQEIKVLIKGTEFRTRVVLPISLNGHDHRLPIIPVKTDKGFAWIAWLDPDIMRNPTMAHDGSYAMAKLISLLPPEKRIMHTAPSGKSGYLTDFAAQIASSNGRTIAVNPFRLVSNQEELEHINENPGRGFARWYKPVTEMVKGKGMGLEPGQVQMIQESDPNAHFVADDVKSLGGTIGAIEDSIKDVYKMVGKDVSGVPIPKVVLAIEVLDVAIDTYVPSPDLYAAIIIPEITTPIVKTSSSELFLEKLAPFPS